MTDEFHHHMASVFKGMADVLSIGVVVGTLAQYLPAIAALFSIIWSIIRIVESKTFRTTVRRLRKQPLD